VDDGMMYYMAYTPSLVSQILTCNHHPFIAFHYLRQHIALVPCHLTGLGSLGQLGYGPDGLSGALLPFKSKWCITYLSESTFNAICPVILALTATFKVPANKRHTREIALYAIESSAYFIHRSESLARTSLLLFTTFKPTQHLTSPTPWA